MILFISEIETLQSQILTADKLIFKKCLKSNGWYYSQFHKLCIDIHLFKTGSNTKKPLLVGFSWFVGWLVVGFYGISTLVGYSMPNPVYTIILNIYDL